MKEAGYGEGGKPLSIEIRYNTNPNHERVATAIADMWKNTFGAKVSLVNLDVASHYGYLQEGGKFNVARAGWVADYADAENFLALSVSSTRPSTIPSSTTRNMMRCCRSPTTRRTPPHVPSCFMRQRPSS